ncbi:MAG: hypothetical protein FVQ80_14980 [Planctomycetes bacterium]|nr:hypothetical protein [Planctomycetota bacterium]
MAELITLTEFGRRMGVSQPMISKAVGSGRIQKTASGKIDWDSQSIAWEQNRRVEKDHQSRGSSTGGGQVVKGSDYQKVLTACKYYESKIRELKFKEMEGNVLSKESIQKYFSPKLALIKSHMMSIPARHSYTLSAMLIRHVEKISKAKTVLKVLSKIDEQQLAREIGEMLDSDIRRLLKEISSVEHF